MERIELPEHLSGEALAEWAAQVTARLNLLGDLLGEEALGRRIKGVMQRAQQEGRVLQKP